MTLVFSTAWFACLMHARCFVGAWGWRTGKEFLKTTSPLAPVFFQDGGCKVVKIKEGPEVTLNSQRRPPVITDNLIQSHRSVFVTWSPLNKSYARNYTLPLDHISPR